MRYKYFYGFLLALSFAGYNAQVSDAVKKLAQPLDTISYAESSHIGYGGEESKIYNQFKKVAKVASNDELYYFAMNGSNALKLYSGKELFKRKDKRFFDVYAFYSKNPLKMEHVLGCTIDRKNIAEFLKDEVYTAPQYISLRDQLLKKKGKQDEIVKIQLSQIKERGYDKLTEEDVRLVKKDLEKIDQKQN
ncbi:hypothetical protein WH221_09485 [Chryseobacterium culicis]|uniref:Uncharacterized protein n=1 Tax=Chryseobacterium culicis TaxID=680127 RepID=A0A2S9D109_CHRCI|nr:hypothetical protein [Chryseobacterium culicis]PRB86457.1 hypothetical protein CQ022_09465 [Chryseobacterium culicis]PRB92210.1 hypothetical protein CQ033_03135 [Chryseobacterium culicis]